MKRVYVAGAYSADKVLDVFDNMRVGMRIGTEILLMGFAPFVPWFDYHFQLMLRQGENLFLKDYYRYSVSWLEVSDYMFVLPNSQDSKGTQDEIKIATNKRIPIFYSLEDLKKVR